MRTNDKRRAKGSKTVLETSLVKVGASAVSAALPRQPFDAGAVVQETNRRIRTIGLEHEALCVYLVNTLFGGDAHAALAPKATLEPRYLALRARAGKSLELAADELREHTRIGAIFLLRPNDDLWRGIAWSEKLELLPLLALGDERKKFNEGVLFAARGNVGREHVRKFVQDATPRLSGSVGSPRGAQVTITKGSRFAETGVQLGSTKQREDFAKQLEKAPPARRRELVRDLKKTLENLGELLKLLGDGK